MEVSQLILAMDYASCYDKRYEDLIFSGLTFKKDDDIPKHYGKVYKWAAAMFDPFGPSQA